MKRYIVLGVNENPKYLYYLPLVVWAWRRIGWEPIVFRTKTPYCWQVHNDVVKEYFLDSVEGFKSETIAQVSRLYAVCAHNNNDDILMTSDADMLPLSNYWNPSDLNVTCYGRDLTDYHYPICYCAMTGWKWLEVMMICSSYYNNEIRDDLNGMDKNTNAWLWDQDILTQRLNKYGKKLLTLVHRGTDKRTGYPIGRVDRSHWTLDHKVLIDAHLPHDILTNEQSFKKVLDLLHHVWPSDDWKWFINYHKEFKKLL